MSDFLDLREFRSAAAFVIKVTKRTEAEILNRGALVALIGGKGVQGAIKRTPRAKLAGAALDPKKVAGFVADKLRKKGIKLGRGGAPAPRARQRGAGGRFVRGGARLASVSAGSGVSTKEFQQLVKREIARRKSSVAYTAGPGWDKAARAFGGRGVKRQKGFDKSKAAGGSGHKASASLLVATLENTAPAAAKIGTAALQAALDDTAKDIRAYGERKLAQTLAKASAK